MTLTMRGLSWQDHARCGDVHPDVFFPPDGGDTRRAKGFCAVCPVWAECLAYGLDEDHGVWGGLNRAERNRLRRLQRRYLVAPGHPANATDLRRLALAGMSPERLSLLLDISAETITDLARPKRRKAS